MNMQVVEFMGRAIITLGYILLPLVVLAGVMIGMLHLFDIMRNKK